MFFRFFEPKILVMISFFRTRVLLICITYDPRRRRTMGCVLYYYAGVQSSGALSSSAAAAELSKFFIAADVYVCFAISTKKTSRSRYRSLAEYALFFFHVGCFLEGGRGDEVEVRGVRVRRGQIAQGHELPTVSGNKV